MGGVIFTLYYYVIYQQVSFIYSNPVSTILTENLPWWKTEVLYQIYPRSFKDSNGDGVGDLQGITSKVQYLKSLGVGAIWLSPIYVSPMADFGYDVANYTDIDPIFGTLNDFDELLARLKDNGIKMIMDFIPNHTSDEHEWFEKSVQKIAPYTDYYVWKDPKGFNQTGHPIPPNNWLSVHGSAWEWNEKRKQFYFHQYETKQPDLNVRNPEVLKELEKVIQFWLDRGVDGLRIDALQRLFEIENTTLDEPIHERALDGSIDPNDRDYLNHIYTMNQPETLEVLRNWRRIADSYTGDRMLMAQVHDEDNISKVMTFYGNSADPLAHFPLNFYIVNIPDREEVTGLKLKEVVQTWIKNMPDAKWPNWIIGTHDNPRVSSRFGPDLVDAMNMLLLLLKGTPTSYYGEEIGMEDTFVSFEEAQDLRGINFGPENYHKYGRDPQRTPFQWDTSINAGFSNATKTWLPVNENYGTLNMAAQLGKPESHLEIYRKLLQIRKLKVFIHGNFDHLMSSKDIFSFVRHHQGEKSHFVIINTSKNVSSLNLKKESSYPLPTKGTILLRSNSDTREETKPGSSIDLESLTLLPGEGLVIRGEMG